VTPSGLAMAVIVGDNDALGELSSVIALARPKSSTFTRSSAVSLIFASFRSRWTIPSLDFVHAKTSTRGQSHRSIIHALLSRRIVENARKRPSGDAFG